MPAARVDSGGGENGFDVFRLFRPASGRHFVFTCGKRGERRSVAERGGAQEELVVKELSRQQRAADARCELQNIAVLGQKRLTVLEGEKRFAALKGAFEVTPEVAAGRRLPGEQRMLRRRFDLGARREPGKRQRL
ncbi:MAG TPA: hypothetical protein DFL85_11525, partial [Lentisphaeria bacterium]|nr:hypothetical protein [Lentisphaeria bacterium]